MLDGYLAALSWLGGVRGQRASPLGSDRFGQTGDLPDLYRTYRQDAEAIINARAEPFLNDSDWTSEISGTIGIPTRPVNAIKGCANMTVSDDAITV